MLGAGTFARRTLTVLLASMLAGAGVSVAPLTAYAGATDSYESDRYATAPELQPGTHVGLLNFAGDIRDRFRVTFTADQLVELRLTGPVGTDFDLELFSGGVAATEDTAAVSIEPWFVVDSSINEGTSTESITYLVPPSGGGTYYVEVQTFNGSGAYTLTYSQVSSPVVRLGGRNRFATSYAISRSSFTTASAVVVASGASFPAALAAAGLAGALGGPVLLAPQATRSDDPTLRALLHEIMRLRATEVIVVGGPAVVNDMVYQQLKDGQFVNAIRRVSGRDRYETARRIAEETIARSGGTASVFLVRGDQFADALAVAPYAYNMAIPVLLTRPAALHPEARSFIENRDVRDVVVAGGEAAVMPRVITETRALNGSTTRVVRLGGLDRYATAAEVARYCIDIRGWGTWDRFGITTGMNFPDALSGATANGVRGGGALLLTTPTVLSPAAKSILDTKAGIDSMALIFGGETAVSNTVMSSVRSSIR